MVLRGPVRPLLAPWSVVLAVALSGLGAASCHKVPLVAPSGSALTLIASPSTVSVNGSAEIVAVVIEGAQGVGTETEPGAIVAGVGTPVHDGTLVVFTTSLGRIEPSEAETVDGRAVVRLVADGRSGTATITAFSGGATNTLDVDIGAAAATRIAVTANPQSLPPSGGTSDISARVEDQQGNAVSGIPVSFSTSSGTLSSTTVPTNELGFALTKLTTTTEATVTATTGGSATSLSGTVTVTVRPATTLAITPPPSAMLGVPASFTITPGTETVITGVEIDFGDGTSASLGSVTYATLVSHLFRRTGELTVTARATATDGGSTTVSTRVSVVPLGVVGSASPPPTATTPKVGDTITLTVTPTNATAVIDRVQWDFGDGAYQTTESTSIMHAYGSSGPKVATARVFPYGSGEATTVLIVVDVKD
jgi:hypothetical protein